MGLLKGFLKEKGSVIETIAQAVEESSRIQKGLAKAKESVLNGSEANSRKMLYTTMKSVESQSKIITQLSLICLVYASGGNFTGDVAQSLAKLGHGHEAIREMFKQKMSMMALVTVMTNLNTR